MSYTLKYVGKKSPYTGKTLWEIIGQLKDFGIGRLIVRNSEASLYKEPCYLKILEVTGRPNWVPPSIKVFRPPNDLRDKDRPRRVHIVAERVFCGIKHEQPIEITAKSELPDYSLVPKHLESNYTFSKLESQAKEENIYPQYTDYPPLLKYILTQNGVAEPKLRATMEEHPYRRIAKDNEQPNKQYVNGFGKPASPNLYKDINYDI